MHILYVNYVVENTFVDDLASQRTGYTAWIPGYNNNAESGNALEVNIAPEFQFECIRAKRII